MVSLIIQTAKNFLRDQIQLVPEETDTLSQMRTVIASIDIKMDNGKVDTVYVGFNETLLKEIVSVYLFEDEADEQTMIDMALESTNMIVGSAKVLAEQAEKAHFMITTPEFKAIETFQNCLCSEFSGLNTTKGGLVIGIKG